MSSRRGAGGSGRTWARRVALAAWLAYAAIGLVWTAANLGDVPHYGDSKQYLRYSQETQVNEVRGYLYPRVLAAANRSQDSRSLRRLWREWKAEEASEPPRHCRIPPEYTSVQLLQILFCGLALGYFLWTVVLSKDRKIDVPQARKLWLVLLALLLFDPLINHFNLALMTDALAFSAALAFCAALATMWGEPRADGEHRALQLVPPLLLVASFLLCAGLRVEKAWVLSGTALGSMSLWWLLARLRGIRWTRERWATCLAAVGLMAAGVLVNGVMQSNASVRDSWWTASENALHFRLVYPHLASVYDELPADVREVISRDDAVEYSADINNVRRVINRVVGDDAAARADLTKVLVRTMLAHRTPELLRATASDIASNTFSTVSFYGRLAGWKLGLARPDFAGWTWTRMAFHHPRLTNIYLLVAVLALLLASIPAALRLAELRAARRRNGPPGRANPDAGLELWIPAVVYWLLNALTFGLSVDVTNVRYMITSHAMIILLVYVAALRRLLPSPRTQDLS